MIIKSSSKYRLCKLSTRLIGGDVWGILLDTTEDQIVMEHAILHFRRSAVVYEGSMQRCLTYLCDVSEHGEEVS